MIGLPFIASAAIVLHCSGSETSGLLQQPQEVSFSLIEAQQGLKGQGGPFERTVDQASRNQTDGALLVLADYAGLPFVQLQLTLSADRERVTWIQVDYRQKDGEGVVEAQGNATCLKKDKGKANKA